MAADYPKAEPVMYVKDSDHTTLYVAIVATVVSPSLLALMTNRARRKDKQLDWAREDVVAKKAEEAARLLVESNKEIADKVEKASKNTDSQLRQIHTLVNSDMTAARMDQRDQTRLTLLATKKIIQLDRDAGRVPSPEDMDAIATAETQIRKLDAILADRAEQQKQVENEQRSHASMKV
jgi:hypothetical protein